MWTEGANGAIARGYDCLTFDGPGQGYALWKQNLHFRPDWEKVITPVVDYALSRADVDPKRIAIQGISQGGHWVPRAVAFEKRIAAAIADPGVIDVSTAWTATLPKPMLQLLQAGRKPEFDGYMTKELGPAAKAALAFRMRPFGFTSYYDTFKATMDYNLKSVAGQITCPMLITDPVNESFFPGQSRQLYNLRRSGPPLRAYGPRTARPARVRLAGRDARLRAAGAIAECPAYSSCRGSNASEGMDMKRRQVLAMSASAFAGAMLPGAAVEKSAAATQSLNPIGDFILGRAGIGLQIMHRLKPDRILWETEPDGNFIVAEAATADIKEFGAPEGTFSIIDTVSASYQKPTIDDIAFAGGGATVSGTLTGTTGKVGYTLAFEAVSTTHLRFVISVNGSNASRVDRIRLRLASTKDEAFFGFGEQLTYFNQKGKVLPILVQEHGIGRGRLVITQLVDVLDHGSGGNPYHTGVAAPHFISSRLRSLFLENLEYSEFDLRQADHVDIKV
jgi:hypothetical protein